MRKYIKISNICNPALRMVSGIQNCFAASVEMLEQITQDADKADVFECLYAKNGIEVYEYIHMLSQSYITFYNLKYIAAREGIPEWIVAQGCIPVNKPEQLRAHQRHAKRMLIKSIKQKWGIDLMKGA